MKSPVQIKVKAIHIPQKMSEKGRCRAVAICPKCFSKKASLKQQIL